MDEEEREKRRVNMRNYRKRNPDKVKARNKTYRDTHRKELSRKNKTWRKTNQTTLAKKKKEYVLKNKGKVSEVRKKSEIRAKKAALEAYGGPNPECQCCEEDDFFSLCVDHENGGGNAHRRSVGVV
ncbi:hypothetical protein LCGC14_2543290, partial [marine sediment metagenome]